MLNGRGPAQLHLIIVSGLPGSGKTTVAAYIAQTLALPLFTRDDVKESIFDHLGWSDAEWSERVSSASYAILYDTMERLLGAGVSHVVDSNFDPELDAPCFIDLQSVVAYHPIQVLCLAPGDVLFERMQQRPPHPGHAERLDLPRLKELLINVAELPPLTIGGEVIIVDTSTLPALDYATLDAQLQAALSP